MIDEIKVSGELMVRVLDAKTGAVRQIIETPNTICVNGLNALQFLLAALSTPAEETQDANKIWAIYAGTDNTTPAYAQTDLLAPQFYKAVDQPISTDVGGVPSVLGYAMLECQMTMQSTEGNGYTYQEAGLFTRGTNASDDPSVARTNVNMIARQIHAAVPKDSTISIEYTWRIRISAG